MISPLAIIAIVYVLVAVLYFRKGSVKRAVGNTFEYYKRSTYHSTGSNMGGLDNSTIILVLIMLYTIPGILYFMLNYLDIYNKFEMSPVQYRVLNRVIGGVQTGVLLLVVLMARMRRKSLILLLVLVQIAIYLYYSFGVNNS